MTKKDYIRAAEIVRDIGNEHGDNAATGARLGFIELFRGDNPRFDTERFNEACEGVLRARHNTVRRKVG